MRFLNHGRPQSYTEGFDGWFEMPQVDPGEGVISDSQVVEDPWFGGRPKTDPGEGSNKIAFNHRSLRADGLGNERSPCPGTTKESRSGMVCAG